MADEQTQSENGGGVATAKDTLSITDNRTGEQYDVEIVEGETIKAMDLRQIKVNEDDFGMMTYDPAFTNTASTKSAIPSSTAKRACSSTAAIRSSSSASSPPTSRSPTC